MGIVQEQPNTRTGSNDVRPCPVCDTTPVVLIALRHPVMRSWTEALLATDHGCWDVANAADDELLVDAIARTRPDLVVVDDIDFPSCCQAALDRLPRERVVVVGPEPDPAYESSAMGNGAGGWVCRDHVGDELSAAVRSALGCHHEPCPTTREPTSPGSYVGGTAR